MNHDSTTPSLHVVLTGGSGALGRAVARHFLDAGARLAFIEHEPSRLDEILPTLDRTRHVCVQADVRSADSVAAAGATILHALGHVDALIHLAGGFEMGPAVHTLDRAAWDRMMDLNAWSFVALARAFVPAMIARGGGRVVAVSARSAAQGQVGQGAYIAAKSALQRLVEAMAAEVAPHGIAVNSVAPRILDTPANRQAMPQADATRWVSTQAAAQAIAFLVSGAASAVQGQHLGLGE